MAGVDANGYTHRSAMFELIDWLAKQPTAVATFLGTLAGSSIGLFALLLGALFNARLNRVRDDRLRMEEASSIRGALQGELTGIRDAFNRMADKLEKDASEIGATGGRLLIPEITAGIRVMPALVPKFGLLSTEMVHYLMNVYVMIEQFRPNLLLIGGTLHSDSHPNRGFVEVPGARADAVAQMARNSAKAVDAAITVLSQGRASA